MHSYPAMKSPYFIFSCQHGRIIRVGDIIRCIWPWGVNLISRHEFVRKFLVWWIAFSNGYAICGTHVNDDLQMAYG